MQVVVLGAAGQLGTEVVSTLSARGHLVCAAVRRPPPHAFERSVEIRFSDGRNKADLHKAIRGFDAVVNVIGGGTLRKNDVESTTSRTAAAEEVGVRRYIAMSAGMVALDWALFKYLRPLIFRHILAEHRRVDEIVTGSALASTRAPTALTNRPATGYAASLQLQPNTFVTSRTDVAAFIAEELEGNTYIRQAVFVTSRHERDIHASHNL